MTPLVIEPQGSTIVFIYWTVLIGLIGLLAAMIAPWYLIVVMLYLALLFHIKSPVYYRLLMLSLNHWILSDDNGVAVDVDSYRILTFSWSMIGIEFQTSRGKIIQYYTIDTMPLKTWKIFRILLKTSKKSRVILNTN